jgi:hypothetical protein
LEVKRRSYEGTALRFGQQGQRTAAAGAEAFLFGARAPFEAAAPHLLKRWKMSKVQPSFCRYKDIRK